MDPVWNFPRKELASLFEMAGILDGVYARFFGAHASVVCNSAAGALDEVPEERDFFCAGYPRICAARAADVPL